MSREALSRESEQLLKQAAELRLISLLFECPTPSWKRDVEALTGTIQDTALQSAGLLALEQGSEGIYHSVFGPGGPVAPREVSYHEVVQLGSLMSELAGYYSAFAYEPQTTEAGDHVSVETGFFAYLRMKLAYAQFCKDPERADVTAEAAKRFVADHLSVMAEPLAASLRDSGIEYLALAAAALLARVGPALNTAPPRADVDRQDCEWECGR